MTQVNPGKGSIPRQKGPRGVYAKTAKQAVGKHVEGIIQSGAKIADLQFRNVGMQVRYGIMGEGVKEKDYKVATQSAILTASLLSMPGAMLAANSSTRKITEEPLFQTQKMRAVREADMAAISGVARSNTIQHFQQVDRTVQEISHTVGKLSDKSLGELEGIRTELATGSGRFADVPPIQKETLKNNVELAINLRKDLDSWQAGGPEFGGGTWQGETSGPQADSGEGPFRPNTPNQPAQPGTLRPGTPDRPVDVRGFENGGTVPVQGTAGQPSAPAGSRVHTGTAGSPRLNTTGPAAPSGIQTPPQPGIPQPQAGTQQGIPSPQTVSQGGAPQTPYGAGAPQPEMQGQPAGSRVHVGTETNSRVYTSSSSPRINNAKQLQNFIRENDNFAQMICPEMSGIRLSQMSLKRLEDLQGKVEQGTGAFAALDSASKENLTGRIEFAKRLHDKDSYIAKANMAYKESGKSFAGYKIPGGTSVIGVAGLITTAVINTADDDTIRGYRNLKSTYQVAKMLKGVAVKTGAIAYMAGKTTVMGTANYAYLGFKFFGKDDAADSIRKGMEKVQSAEDFFTQSIPDKITDIKDRRSEKKVEKKEARQTNVMAAKARVSNTVSEKITAPVKQKVSKVVKVSETTQKRVQVVGKAAKKAGRTARKAAAVPFRAVGFASKVYQVFTNTTEAIKQAAVKLATKAVSKVLVPAIGAVVPILINVATYAMPIIVLFFIVAAVSSSAAEFKERTSMGAAYTKLMEKEAKFTAAIQEFVANADMVIPPEITEAYGITEYSGSDICFIDGDGQYPKETSTIKQILSMAAIYIEQDFDKYGAFLDNTLTDSVYKDYCAKLYDSSHIIAYAPPTTDGEGIYYCNANEPGEGGEGGAGNSEDVYSYERGHAPALDDCNNHTEGLYKGDGRNIDPDSPDYETPEAYNERLEKLKEENSTVALREMHLRLDDSGTPRYEYNEFYSLIQLGPHGSGGAYNTMDLSADPSAMEAEFTDAGCTNHEWICVNVVSGDMYYEEVYELVCTCGTCRGHIDAPIYVFISNAYMPPAEGAAAGDAESEGGAGAGAGAGAGGTEDEAEDYSEAKEMKYSLYAIDKYATAFNEAGIMISCTNKNCSGYEDGVIIPEGSTRCPLCGADLTKNMDDARVIDQASVDEAQATEDFAAEKAIMDDLTGKNCTIYDWWGNENWFTDLTTDETYFRIVDGGDINDLERPESGDRNVVNAGNSHAYKFNAFTTPEKRNRNFEKHGWDQGSIELVRLLMLTDWKEVYGIDNFGYVDIFSGVTGSRGGNGSSLSDAQIAQMLSTNTDYEDLCFARKEIMNTTLQFYNQIKRLNVHYHGAGCSAHDIEALKAATDDRSFGIGSAPICPKEGFPCLTQPGIDCSGFVSWILNQKYPGLFAKRETTSSLLGKVGSALIPTNDPKPGDIALKSGHVMMYIGSGKFAEASGHKNGILYGSTHSDLSKYTMYKVSAIDDSAPPEDETADVGE